MKNKRLQSYLMIIILIFSISFSSVELVKADTAMKQHTINQTTLEFKEIIYIDGTNGDDTIGDGSKEKPFATVVKGFDYMSENCLEDGAIVIADGNYDINALFDRGYTNDLKKKYVGIKISLIAENLGNVTFTALGMEWHCTQIQLKSFVQISFYGIILDAQSTHYLSADAWPNRFYNCVIAGTYGGWVQLVEIYNCLFTGTASSAHLAQPLSGTAINSASVTDTMEPANGTKEYALYNVNIDSNYNITSDGWQNAGSGKNPDDTQAHIGVYGGSFAWSKKAEETLQNQLHMVLEVEEMLLLSVDNHISENKNMTWISSDESVAAVDENGFVTALKPGEITVTATSKNGKYIETINILIVEDANDYRIAVDLKISESCRVTIDKNKHITNVTWKVADESIATISSKGKITAQGKGLTIVTAVDESDKTIGQVYIRVR